MSQEVLESMAKAVLEGRVSEASASHKLCCQMQWEPSSWKDQGLAGVYDLRVSHKGCESRWYITSPYKLNENPGDSVEIPAAYIKEAVEQSTHVPAVVVLSMHIKIDRGVLSKALLDKELTVSEPNMHLPHQSSSGGLLIDICRTHDQKNRNRCAVLRAYKEYVEISGDDFKPIRWSKAQWGGVWSGDGRAIMSALASASKLGLSPRAEEFFYEWLVRTYPSAYAIAEKEVLNTSMESQAYSSPIKPIAL